MIKLKDLITEGETLIATGKDKQGKKIEMFRTVRWGGLITHILKKNGKEYDQYPPNLKNQVAKQRFKQDFKNTKIVEIKKLEKNILEASNVWKRFDKLQSLYGNTMDIETDMKDIARDLKLAHREMEQEAEPEGGPTADRYADQIHKLEKEYNKQKKLLKKYFREIEKVERF